MKLFPAICPQCSANLEFAGADEYVVCNHCQTKIFIIKDDKQSPDFDRLLNLGKISEESPVGAAIIGQPIGTIALVEAPKGMKKYEILNIEK